VLDRASDTRTEGTMHQGGSGCGSGCQGHGGAVVVDDRKVVDHVVEDEDAGIANAALRHISPGKKVQTARGRVGVDDVLSLEELRTLYTQARLDYSGIENSNKHGNDPELQEDIKRCIETFVVCDECVRKFALFSKNEDKEDVNTEDLCFVLLNYYVAKLRMKIISIEQGGSGPSARLETVVAGRQAFDAFLERCNVLGLLDSADKALFLSFQTDSAPPRPSREVKMGRYMKSRAAKNRLEEVTHRLRRLKKIEEVDEDLEREKATLDIECAVKSALEDIESSVQELQILEHMSKMNIKLGAPPPPPPPSKGLEVTRIDPNFNMTRETVKAETFRPSWRQPTMSVEEYGEIEYQRAMERAKREEEHLKANPEIMTGQQVHEEGLEDDEAIVDKATEKDRYWDDYKDDNPKGRGVTKRF